MEPITLIKKCYNRKSEQKYGAISARIKLIFKIFKCVLFLKLL